jgi:chaperonin GroES
MSNIKPLSDKIAILPDATSRKLESGIELPGNFSKTSTQTGRVVAVGPGFLLQDGTRVPPSVAVGDKVAFSVHSGAELEVEEVTYVILNEEQILAQIAVK